RRVLRPGQPVDEHHRDDGRPALNEAAGSVPRPSVANGATGMTRSIDLGRPATRPPRIRFSHQDKGPPMSRVTHSVRTFLEDYERGIDASDAQLIASRYDDPFVFAGPRGVQVIKKGARPHGHSSRCSGSAPEDAGGRPP